MMIKIISKKRYKNFMLLEDKIKKLEEEKEKLQYEKDKEIWKSMVSNSEYVGILENNILKLRTENSNLSKNNKEYRENINFLLKNVTKLKKSNNSLKGSKGSLIAQINKLNKKINSLEDKTSENKYLVKHIRDQKNPKMITNYKLRNPKNNQVRKQLKDLGNLNG